MSESQQPEVSPEALALQSIAKDLSGLRRDFHSPVSSATDRLMKELVGDPKEEREIERAEREREQGKLYRLAVLLAGISAFASIASVLVAAISA